MLHYDPNKRISALDALKSPWLNMEPNYNYIMNDEEFEEFCKRNVESSDNSSEKPIENE